MNKRFYSLLFCLLLLPQLLLSQGFIVKNYSSKEGLIHSQIYDLNQNNDGFITIIGDKGLSRFNGTKFLNHFFALSQSKVEIKKIAKSNDQSLLILKHSGKLAISEESNLIDLLLPPQISKLNFSTFKILDDKHILMGTTNSGLVLYNDSITTIYNSNDGLYSDSIKDIYDDNFNTYIVTSKGINIFKENKILPLLENINHNFESVVKDAQNNYWSFTSDQGLFLYAMNDTGEFSEIKIDNFWMTNKNGDYQFKSTKSNGIYLGQYIKYKSIVEDKNGFLWLVTDKGLYRIIKNGLGEIYLFLEIPETNIENLTADQVGNIWYSVSGKGLFKVSKSFFDNYSFENQIPSSNVELLFEDNSDRIWFTDGNNNFGFQSCERGFQLIQKPKGFENQKAISITTYDEQNLLLSFGEKILLLGPSGYKETEFDTFLPNNIRLSVYQDSKDQIWIGMKDVGLWKAVNNKVEKIGFTEQTISVFDIFEDRLNGLWLNTSDGLYFATDHSFKKMDSLFNYQNLNFNVFEADHDGNIWIGTDQGIYILKNQVLIDSINFPPEFSSNNITSFGPLHNAMLIGTTNGLVLNHNNQFKLFSNSDGLGSNIINGKRIISDLNKTFIGTNAGFSIFHVDEYFAKQYTPTIYLSKYLSNFGTIHIPSNNLQKSYQLNLKKGIKYIEISLDVINLNNMLYESNYKIVHNGDISDWINILGDEIFLNQPEAGNYKLLIQSNFVGQLKKSEVEISFKVKNAFYSTILFKLIVVSFVLTFALAVWIKKRKQQNQRKEKYKTSSLSAQKSKTIKESLELLMIEKQYYRNPELSLQLLSQELNVSKEYISQVLNTQFNSNFNTLVNSYRVSEACALLKENEGKTSNILQIGYFVGFNSKSSFNNAFKKQTGLTPTQYQNKFKKMRPK